MGCHNSKNILSNEKYHGDALLQKTFCEDFLTKKFKTNEGEVPQYYVENNHEAIIDDGTFEMVQQKLARRTGGKNRHSGTHIFASKIKCGDCGGWYGAKVWHSQEKCKRVVWQCNQKYKNEVRCSTPFLDEVTIRSRFTKAANQLLAGRKEAIAAYEAAQACVLDTTGLEAQQAGCLLEMQTVREMINLLIKQNAAVAQDQAVYNEQYESLTQRFQEAERRHKDITAQISDIVTRRGTMDACIKLLHQQKGELTEFSEDLWCRLVDYATVYPDGRMTFTFKAGQTIEG